MHGIGLADQRFKMALSSSIGSSNTAAIPFTFLLLLVHRVCFVHCYTVTLSFSVSRGGHDMPSLKELAFSDVNLK